MGFLKRLFGGPTGPGEGRENVSASVSNRDQSGRAGKKHRATTTDADRLIEAAKSGAVSAVRALVEQGLDVNAKDKSGTTAVRTAAGRCDLTMVRALLSLGADPCLAGKNSGGLSEDAFSAAWEAEVEADSDFVVLGELVGAVSALPNTVPILDTEEALYLGVFLVNDLREVPRWVSVAIAVRSLQRMYGTIDNLSALSDLAAHICSVFKEAVPICETAATEARVPDGAKEVSQQSGKLLNTVRDSCEASEQAEQESQLRATAEVMVVSMLKTAIDLVLSTDTSGAAEALAKLAANGANAIASTEMALCGIYPKTGLALPSCLAWDVRQGRATINEPGWSADQGMSPQALGPLWATPVSPEG